MAQGSSNPTVDIKKVGGAVVDKNIGAASSGTQRVVLASDQTSIPVAVSQSSSTITISTISSTSGDFTCTEVTTAILAVGVTVRITGTMGGTGTIDGITTGGTINKTYKVSTTNNRNTFKLVNLDGTAIVTISGSPTGLTFTVGAAQNITNISQLAGQNISMGTGTRDAGTQRVTIATNDLVPVSDNGGSISVDDNSGSLTVDAPVGTPVFVRLSDGTNAITALPITDNSGSITVDGTTGNSETVTEDAASVGGEKLFLMGAVRQDLANLAPSTSADGDYSTLKVTNNGRLYASVAIDTALPAGSAILGQVKLVDTAGSNQGTIKAASTAAVATDTSLVVTFSPNTGLPTGSNTIGKLAANDTVDIGDVTINNASIAVTKSGTWAVDSVGSITNALPTGANTIGSVEFVSKVAGSNLNATSVTLESNRVIKNGAGTLYMLSGINNKTTSQYIHVYNTAALPAEGSIPAVVFFVPPTSNFSFDFGVFGRSFSTGITVGNSSTLATKTLGSADCWFDAQYK